MATKKISTIQKTADSIKVQAKQVADTAIVVSETLVDGSLVTGERWQKLMAKSLKEGTVLFGKQQDMVLDTLEIARDQYLKGNVRLRKLFGIKAPSFMKAVEDVVEEVTKPAAAKVKAIKETSNAAIEMATATISKAMNGAPAKAKKVAKTVATAKTNKAVKATKATVTKATPKKVKTVTAKKKAVAKKVITKKVAPKKVTANKNTTSDNLTKIEGVGPKIEQLLNKAGIRSFKMLGAVDVKTLRTILDNAGPRYKMHNPKTWRTQAKLAANGKWDKLNDLQKELKGGVKVKK